MDAPYVTLWGTADEVRIFTVDGDEIRKSIDPAFTGYGEPERDKYVPGGEVWVDSSTAPDKVEMIAACAILQMERAQVGKGNNMKMNTGTMQRLGTTDPDVRKMLNGGSEALAAALAKRGLVEKDLTVGDVHVSGDEDGATGLTLAEIQRRAKDQKPKVVNTDTGKVGKVDLRALLEKAQATSFDEVMAEVEKAAPRALKPHPDGGAYSPFPHDPQALDKLKPDQVKRFLDAATKGTAEQREVPIKSLVAMHDKVDPDKLNGIQDARDNGNADAGLAPIVAHYDSKNYIVDGHHRAAVDYLNGANKINVNYVDLGKREADEPVVEDEPEPVAKSEAQSITININAPAVAKTDAAIARKLVNASGLNGRVIAKDDVKKIVWAWANVITEGGVPVVDVQDDMITPDELVKCTTDFMVDERVGNTDHVGGQTHMVIHSLPLTYELAKAFGIQTDNEGWLVGLRVDDEPTMQRVDVGDLIALSIEGSGDRTPL